MQERPAPIRIIHYNDVYNIDVSPREPVGGAARFVNAIKQTIDSHRGETLVLFSGDAFSPAPLTSITKGAEIPHILNATSIDVACIGNHELDNGLHVMKQRISETNFPWLISNVFERHPEHHVDPTSLWEEHNSPPLGGIHLSHTITRGGFKFGFLGLAAYDWLANLDKVRIEDVIYVNFCEAAKRVSYQLRYEHHCDFVIALTHMKQPDDEQLAHHVKGIDLILGGHDHILSKKFINGRWVVKSGTDFKNFTTIDLQITLDGKLKVEEPIHYAVTSEYTEDPEIASFVSEKLELLGDVRNKPLAMSTSDLDGRFVSVRTRETGLGNFVCDVMARHMGAKIGLINAGSFRSDSIEPASTVTQQTIDTILPFKDQVVLVTCSGLEILDILENSVSQYPLLDGRFCQVSGLSFSFDAKKPAGRRINRSSVKCNNENGMMVHIEEEMKYECAMKSYIFSGKEGFQKGDESRILKISEIPVREMVSLYLQPPREGSDTEIPVISPQLEGRINCIHPDDELQQMYKE